MLFHSWEFLFVFLPTIILFFYVIGHLNSRWAIAWLFIGSLLFYGWWSPVHLFLILGSILFNYSIGVLLQRKRRGKRAFLIFGVVCNLFLLFFFKYAMFFVENMNIFIGTSYYIEGIALPLAISFFTFQQIAYLVDSYREEVLGTSFLDYGLFVTFFPQLIAGPIVHHKEMMFQFSDDMIKGLSSTRVSIGLTILFVGLFKKVVLADTLATYANPVFEMAENGQDMHFLTAWIGALSYSFQIYFDFSGYTDIATGVARLLGIRLPMNFYSPYQAVNISEFWRRWHMTLSRFLKDYLYIPLGGNRRGMARRYVNLMTTMLLGGLWHGASWNFIVWGGVHGMYLSIHSFWTKTLKVNLSGTSSYVITFFSVVIAWVFFRAETLSGAFFLLRAMFSISLNALYNLPYMLFGDASPMILIFGFQKTNFVGVFLFLCFFIVVLCPNTSDIMRRYRPYLGEGPKCSKSISRKLVWSPNIIFGCAVAAVAVWGILYVVYKPDIVFLYFRF